MSLPAAPKALATSVGAGSVKPYSRFAVRSRRASPTRASGDKLGPRAHPRDTAVFVIEGGVVEWRESREGGEQSQQAELASSTVLWQPGGWERELTNLGPRPYRELRVEFR
jgi:hypothetical protein